MLYSVIHYASFSYILKDKFNNVEHVNTIFLKIQLLTSS